MSQAFRCDICGEFFGYDPTARVYYRLYEGVDRDSADICEECFTKIRTEILKNRKIEREERRARKMGVRDGRSGDAAGVISEA